jgi:hypothetical protein
MNGLPSIISIVALVLLTASNVAGKGVKLDSREYKLMLDPGKFAGTQSAETINKFWESQLQPVIRRHLDADENEKPRFKKEFESGEARVVRFWDVDACSLDRNGYALRERVVILNGQEDASTRELTLKLRSPDLFVAADTPFDGASHEAETKLEEDIVPVIVGLNPGSRDTAVVVEPQSMRSMFSRSTKQPLAANANVIRLKDVFELYPGLKDNLDKVSKDAPSPQAKLESGKKIRELVFEGAKVDLGEDRDAKFAISLWYWDGQPKTRPPVVAEISFKYKTDKGEVAWEVARRALALFTGLQKDLKISGWANPERASKTSVGLPKKCQ